MDSHNDILFLYHPPNGHVLRIGISDVINHEMGAHRIFEKVPDPLDGVVYIVIRKEIMERVKFVHVPVGGVNNDNKDRNGSADREKDRNNRSQLHQSVPTEQSKLSNKPLFFRKLSPSLHQPSIPIPPQSPPLPLPLSSHSISLHHRPTQSSSITTSRLIILSNKARHIRQISQPKPLPRPNPSVRRQRKKATNNSMNDIGNDENTKGNNGGGEIDRKDNDTAEKALWVVPVQEGSRLDIDGLLTPTIFNSHMAISGTQFNLYAVAKPFKSPHRSADTRRPIQSMELRIHEREKSFSRSSELPKIN